MGKVRGARPHTQTPTLNLTSDMQPDKGKHQPYSPAKSPPLFAPCLRPPVKPWRQALLAGYGDSVRFPPGCLLTRGLQEHARSIVLGVRACYELSGV